MQTLLRPGQAVERLSFFTSCLTASAARLFLRSSFLAAHSSVLFYAAWWVATGLASGDCERRFPGIEKAPIFLSVLCNYFILFMYL